MILVLFYIITLTPPINKTIYILYNSIFGKIIFLVLIIYYAENSDDIMNSKIAILLTILYILLMININTQNNILDYGKDLNKSLLGGGNDNSDNHHHHDHHHHDHHHHDHHHHDHHHHDHEEEDEEDEEDEEGEEEDEEGEEENDELTGGNNHGEEIDKFKGGKESDIDLESTDEENIDKKIENIIQEEIVLNKKTYKNNLKKARRLGAKQNKLNNKYKNMKNNLEKQTEKYNLAQAEYNKIMEEVKRYDTNNDGLVDYNDTAPEMESMEEEMKLLEKELNNSMKQVKSEQEELDKLIVNKKTTTKGGNITLEGYDNEMYSIY